MAKSHVGMLTSIEIPPLTTAMVTNVTMLCVILDVSTVIESGRQMSALADQGHQSLNFAHEKCLENVSQTILDGFLWTPILLSITFSIVSPAQDSSCL